MWSAVQQASSSEKSNFEHQSLTQGILGFWRMPMCGSSDPAAVPQRTLNVMRALRRSTQSPGSKHPMEFSNFLILSHRVKTDWLTYLANAAHEPGRRVNPSEFATAAFVLLNKGRCRWQCCSGLQSSWFRTLKKHRGNLKGRVALWTPALTLVPPLWSAPRS